MLIGRLTSLRIAFASNCVTLINIKLEYRENTLLLRSALKAVRSASSHYNITNYNTINTSGGGGDSGGSSNSCCCCCRRCCSIGSTSSTLFTQKHQTALLATSYSYSIFSTTRWPRFRITYL